MCKYVCVTIDFSYFGLNCQEYKVPVHFTISQLMSILVGMQQVESFISDKNIDSAIARVSSQYISSVQTLEECNIQNGEILYLLA